MKNNSAFTLIEIAIVLTIIGLIIGGIFTAQNLIRNTQLQSVIKDVDRYKKAVQLFKEKYGELPGDMPTATNFWGIDTGCVASPLSDATVANAIPKTATCNGNGDRSIGDSTGTALGNATNGRESFRMWQQLADAGFIDGSYTGAFSNRAPQTDPGMNTPLSKITGSTFLLLHVQPPSPLLIPAGEFDANYRHIIVFGAPSKLSNNAVNGPIPPYYPSLTASEAFSIDQKMDDGYPGTGNILSYTPGLLATPNCATSATPPAAYKVSTSGNVCSLIFITGF